MSISQPYVRPIVRGKLDKPVEFGAKLSVSLTLAFTTFRGEVTHEVFVGIAQNVVTLRTVLTEV